jgi:hypothetical protein
MANKRQCVPVYSTHGNELRRTTVADAEYMLEVGTAKRVSRLKAPLKIQLTQLERVDGSSPCSISYQEALANVGISDKRGDHNFVSRSRMKAVQEKVAAFAIPSWQDRVVTA